MLCNSCPLVPWEKLHFTPLMMLFQQKPVCSGRELRVTGFTDDESLAATGMQGMGNDSEEDFEEIMKRYHRG